MPIIMIIIMLKKAVKFADFTLCHLHLAASLGVIPFADYHFQPTAVESLGPANESAV